MSIAGIPDAGKAYKKSHHRKSDSEEEELDVFEAARYFSGANEMYAYTNNNGAKFSQIIGKEQQRLQEKQGSTRAGRFSLDMPTRSDSIPSQNRHHLLMEKAQMIKDKKKQHKQPSSPGGKLAHFLNSLFSQSSSRNKKKSKSTTSAQSTKDEDQSPGWRRKRRSSISHFQSSNTTTSTSITPAALDSKSVYSLSSSGFRTPPPYSFTPTTTSYKGFRSHSEYHHHEQEIMSFSKQLDHVKSVSVRTGITFPEKKHNLDYAWLDDKLKSANQNLHSYRSKNRGITEKSLSDGNGYREFNDDDDDADSDSSSDLFELPNYDLGCYSSSGLPVYETTNMDSIKRSAAITSGC